jgi:hypothetical protein
MKVNKETIKQLKDIAAKLPVLYHADNRKEYVYKLGAMNVSPIIGESKPINHFQKMLGIYKKSETALEIRDYINNVLIINVTHAKAIKEKNERLKMLMS